MNDRELPAPAQSQLVLSLFSGVGLLDAGFERNGFCVVRGPELITGGDVRNFRALPGRFDGVIGGSPCQDFSRARRTPPTGQGLELLGHFVRIVQEADPGWFLLENVPAVPDIALPGYHVQRFELSPIHLGYSQRRNRHFQFGSKCGLLLDIRRSGFTGTPDPCVTASEFGKTGYRSFDRFCRLQGLPAGYDLPEFHRAAKYRAVGNGVHVGVATEVARAICESTSANTPRTIHNSRSCACGCGRLLTGRQQSAGPTCRKRLEKKRKRVKAGL